MPTPLRKLFRELRKPKSGWIDVFPATIGKADGTVFTDTDGIIWVQNVVNGQEYEVHNAIAPTDRIGLQVKVGRQIDEYIWHVVEISKSYSIPSSAGEVVKRAINDQMIGRDRFLPFLVVPTDGGGMVVTIYGDTTIKADGTIGWVESQTLDLSSYVPADGALYVLIEADDDGVIYVIEGTAVDAKELLTPADIPAITAGRKGSTAVSLYVGQTQLYKDPASVNDFVDVRSLTSSGEGIVSSENVSMPIVGTPNNDTLTDDFTAHGSSGVIDGTLTYVAVGSTAVKISVAAGEGYIRTADDQQGALVFCEWAASPDLYTFSAPAAGQENVIFIGIEYSGGNVTAVTKAAFSDWNWHSNFPLARCSYDGTTMRILNAYAHAEDTANLTRKYLRLTMPFQREEAPEGSGGLEISSALRELNLTAGKLWHGFNNYSILSITAGTFDTHYKRSGGGFNSTTGVTSWPNTQYDDGSGTLQTLTNNRYGALWVYLDVSDGTLDIVYGAVNAVSVAGAQADTVPTTPAHLQYHGRLIGRIIFQKSAASPTLVESAWIGKFSASAVGDHNLLTNLQGGTTNEYYHLTSAQHTDLTDGGDTTLHSHAGGSSDGWIAGTGTWSYSSADDPIFVASVPDADAAQMGVGDKWKVTQTTDKYFVVHAKGSPSGGFTPVTIYGGIDHDLANAAITSPFFSHVKHPLGFPPDPAKYSITVSDANDKIKSSPTNGTFYGGANAWTTGTNITIDIPIGAWRPTIVGALNNLLSGNFVSAVVTLSTGNNSESNAAHTAAAGGFGNITLGFSKSLPIINVAAKTTHYLIARSVVASTTTLALYGSSVAATVIRLECAYL